MTRQFALIATLLCCSVTAARAQVMAPTDPGPATSLSIAAFDPDQAVAPISMVEGPGWKVGDGTVLHPVFGLETGFVSNVFFQSINQQPAGVLRLLGQVGVSSLSTSRLNPNSDPFGATQEGATDRGDLQYQANLRLAYDQPLSDSELVRDTGGLGIGALLRVMANPMGKVSVGADDNFVRLIRAPNFETNGNVNRDVNVAKLTLLYHPPGRSITGYAYYQNYLDVFEHQEDTYPNRMDHRLGLHPMWQWLPQTQVYGDVSVGYISGIGSGAASQMKHSSLPIAARVGIASLLTLKTTANLAVGYTNSSYSSGPGISAATVDAFVSYRYSPLGRIGVGYDLQYVDSVNANYYRDHLIRAFLQQGFDPFVLVVQPELHFREYQGLTIPAPTMTRDDTIFGLVAGVHYNFRNWIAATVNYGFSTVQTDFRYTDAEGTLIDPSYTRHELLLGVRMAM